MFKYPGVSLITIKHRVAQVQYAGDHLVLSYIAQKES
jgi:hypothetical protein